MLVVPMKKVKNEQAENIKVMESPPGHRVVINSREVDYFYCCLFNPHPQPTGSPGQLFAKILLIDKCGFCIV
jgi:hypothetical protein